MSKECGCGCCTQCPPWWVTMGFTPPVQANTAIANQSLNPLAGLVSNAGGTTSGSTNPLPGLTGAIGSPGTVGSGGLFTGIGTASAANPNPLPSLFGGISDLLTEPLKFL
jgi:hypothetical protein